MCIMSSDLIELWLREGFPCAVCTTRELRISVRLWKQLVDWEFWCYHSDNRNTFHILLFRTPHWGFAAAPISHCAPAHEIFHLKTLFQYLIYNVPAKKDYLSFTAYVHVMSCHYNLSWLIKVMWVGQFSINLSLNNLGCSNKLITIIFVCIIYCTYEGHIHLTLLL